MDKREKEKLRRALVSLHGILERLALADPSGNITKRGDLWSVYHTLMSVYKEN